MLPHAGDHADQPHPERHGQVPGGVDNPVEVAAGEAAELSYGDVVDRSQVAEKLSADAVTRPTSSVLWP